jgi:hypothetical protein
MVHCAFTSLHYAEVRLAAIPAKPSGRKTASRAAETVARAWNSKATNGKQSERPASASSANGETEKKEYYSASSDLTESSTQSADAVEAQTDALVRMHTTGCGLSLVQLLQLYDHYVTPLELNLSAIARSVQWLWDDVLPSGMRYSLENAFRNVLLQISEQRSCGT